MTAREVILDGGCPWGFRMNGGADAGHALRISRVNPGSKASVKGVREGDVITSINGQSTKCLTNVESHALLRTDGNTLRLGLNEDTNGSPKRKTKDAIKRDTAGSSTQSVNSTPAAAPSSTTVVDIAVDSTAPSSSNAKGKKSRSRQYQEKTEQNKSKTVQEVQNTVISKTILIETEVNCKSTGMSSSRARRMRKARLNNKKKNGQEELITEEYNTQLINEDSDLTLVKENELSLTKEGENSDNVSNDEDLVEILVVVDSEDLRELHSGTIEKLTELPDLVKEESETVNAWLDRTAAENRSADSVVDEITSSLVKRETQNKCEVLNQSVNNRELNKLENNKTADIQTKHEEVEHFPTNISNDNPSIVNLPETNIKHSTETISKSVYTKNISVVESESSKNSSKIVIKEIVLPKKEDVILPENSRKTDKNSLITEQVKTHSSNMHDCTLCKEKRIGSDVKKVSFANTVVDSEKTATISVIDDDSQDNKKLTCKIGVLPTQQIATQSVVKSTTSESTMETSEVLLRKSPVSVFIHPPDNLAEITNTPRLSWDSVSDIESTSSHTQFSSSDDEIHSDMLIYLPSNEITSAKIVVDTDAQFDDYNLSVHDIRDPLIEPEEEKQLRQYLKTLDLTKPEEFDDSSSSKSHEESSLTSGSETDSTKEEIVVYKHIRSRCIPETCYIPADRRRHLEVITEEGSDPSDVERIPDFSRPWENSTIIRQNNEIHGIPNDWFGSDEDNIETSDEDGIDISWGNGTKLEDVEGVEIVYLGDNSEDDEEIMNRTFRETHNKRNNSLTKPELVVVHEVDLNDMKNTLEICDVVDVNEKEQKKNKVQEIIDILNNTYEINKDTFGKCLPKVENLLNDSTQNSEPKYTLDPNPEEKINLIDSDTNSLENDSFSILSTFNDQKYKVNREIAEQNIDNCDCPVPQEKLDATTPPPTYSRQGSSSSGTGSQSTAKYYPGQSPMSSESEDKAENDANESFNRKKKCLINPKSLKRLAENAVVSLPNGGYFLEQIGFYSQDKPFQVNHEGYKLSHLPPSGVSTRRSSSYQELENITCQPLPVKISPFNSPPGSVVMVSPPGSVVMVTSPPSSCLPSSPPPLEENQWVGMPTSVDPRLLVCLSPSQSKTKTMPTPKEASGLLDLHKKFMERRGYHEQYKRNSFSPINDKSSTPDFTNSPDLLRLDNHESDKSGFYTPELLTEAASLLALKQYRQTRFKQDNNGVELKSKKYESDSGNLVTCESDVEIEEKWKELEAIRSGETTIKFKTNIFTNNKSINETDNSINTESRKRYNLEKTAEFVNILNDTERDLRGKDFTKTVDKPTCTNNAVNHDMKQNYINMNDNVIKEAGVCAAMTSQSTEINEHFDDPDVNRSTGSSTSRLLAIIQGTDASKFSGFNDLRNNTIPLEMNCVENSAGKLQKTEEYRKFIGDNFISNWLTMSQNVGSNTEIDFQNVNENKSVTDQNEFPFIDADTWECFGMNTTGNKYQRQFEADKYKISKQGDIAVMDSDFHKLRRDRPKSLPPIYTPAPTGGELFREKMYQEYMDKVAERSERRQQKVIKISNRPASMYSKIEDNDNNTFIDTHKLENEFMGRVKERMNKLGIPIDADSEEVDENQHKEETHLPEDVHVRLGDEEANVSNLPKHLQEFLELTLAPPTEIQETTTDWRRIRNKQGQRISGNLLKEIDQALILGRGFLTTQGVWSPVGTPEAQRKEFNFKDVQKEESEKNKPEETGGEPAPVIWTPKSANASPTLEKKSFRPVNFESPTLSRKVYSSQNSQEELKPPTDLPVTLEWKKDTGTTVSTRAAVERETHAQTTTSREVHAQCTSSRLVTSHSAPDTSILGTDSKLPRAQNPTITLLQKAREGQLPRGAHYLEQDTIVRDKDNKSPTVYPNEIIYSIRKEYESETEDKQPKKIVELGPRKFEGIGPTTKEGIPIVLRSEVKDVNQQKWYKRMYDSLHKAERDKDSVTVRYKTRRGRYPYTSSGGYLSEPEPLGGGYDSDYISSKYATLDRRRIRNKENDFTTSTMPRNKGYGNAVKHAVDVYKNQPGRIEDYEPGSSSIADKETKQWWDEVMDIFDGQFEQTQKITAPRPQNIPSTRNTKPYMTYALKESGYESDSTLVFKRRDEQQQQLSPAEQKTIYKTIQKGGEVPLHGLRKPAPERPKEPILGRHIPATQRESYPKDRQQESPHRYVESEVTIHYRSPVRAEEKEAWSEEELQRRQAEAMRRIYQEERRRKYLQELQDMYSRRHTDNFTPSQKSPIPLNRYDDFLDDLSPTKPRDRTPEPKLVARALYNFVGQTSRELSFRRGDIIYVRRQIDKNWYEGEHNAMVGLFPFNYVEIIPYDGIRTVPKKASEGQARAKFNFQAQTHLELPLVKGELVLLTRRVDENWYEGRIGNRKGIFPASYVDILVEPGERTLSPVRISPSNVKPIASPASHSLHVSSNMGQHHYQPPRPVSYTSLPRAKLVKPDPPPVNQTLHIDTQNEPVPYRVLYNYKPQNEDELELNEGETVYVMEKCDDGWYVGSSQRTGYLGTFPGNYVERIV